MDMLEYWIWEHAAKHGMSKVLKKLKSDYFQATLPNSWLGALHLRTFKDNWQDANPTISLKELNDAMQTLYSTYKPYKKQLKQFIKTIDYIHLDLVWKATYLVMRECDLAKKKQVRDDVFPIWSERHWNKIKQSYMLKDDLLKDEVKKHHLEIRMKLCQDDHGKKIYALFGTLIRKHFPSIIAFMQRMNLSVLERIQIKKIHLDREMDFVAARLSGSACNEITILNLLEDFRSRKRKHLAITFIREKEMLMSARGNATSNGALYALPCDPTLESMDAQMYPSCFETNSSMPTTNAIYKDGNLQEFVVDKSIPRDASGKAFELHWFSDGRARNIKEEEVQLIHQDGIRDLGTEPTTLGINRKMDEQAKPTNTEPIERPATSESNQEQNKIDDQLPDSPSSSESDASIYYDNRKKEFVPSSVLQAKGSVSSTKASFKKTQSTHEKLLLSSSSDSDVEQNKTSPSKVLGVAFANGDLKKLCSDTLSGKIENETHPAIEAKAASSRSVNSNSKEAGKFSTRIEMKLHKFAKKELIEEVSSDSTDDSVSRLSSRTRSHNRKATEQTAFRGRSKFRNSNSTRNLIPEKHELVKKHHSSRTVASESISMKRMLSEDSDSDITVPSAKKRTGHISSTSTSELEDDSSAVATPSLPDTVSNYQTPDQQNVDSVSAADCCSLSVRKDLVKRNLELSIGTQVKTELLSSGQRILPHLIETLKNQSTWFRENHKSLHSDELDLCLHRVKVYHEKFENEKE